MEHVGLNVNRLSGDLVGPAGVESYASDDGGNIASSVSDGLAVVKGLDGGEHLGVPLQELGELVEELASLMGSHLLPCGVEGLAGGGYGDVDILLGGLADGGDDLFGGGVDDLELLLVNTLDPLVVDEPED